VAVVIRLVESNTSIDTLIGAPLDVVAKTPAP